MYFIAAAAGVGKRMGLDYPKQFLEINGKPIFIKTLEVIESSPKVNGIIVVTNEEYIEKVKEFCKNFGVTKVKNVVSGGKERQDSIYNALLEVPENIEIIGVQDGVRPFIKEKYIDESLEILSKSKDISGVVTGVPVKDTIKIINGDKTIVETPDRATLFAAQTPQIFRSKTLKKAYSEARKDNFLGTDDASLVERLGENVKMIVGSYENIKITTPEDLVFLEV
jgi:2-C-methyl-D-erythritol 4-phosphate cytidylyltransferase